jgi:hypothetical protein
VAAAAARRGAVPTAAAAAPAVRAPLTGTSSGAGTSTGGDRAAAAAQLQQQRRPPEAAAAAAAAAGSSGGGSGGAPGLAAAAQPQGRGRGGLRSVPALINYSGRPLQLELVRELGVAPVLRQSVAVTVSRPGRQVGLGTPCLMIVCLCHLMGDRAVAEGWWESAAGGNTHCASLTSYHFHRLLTQGGTGTCHHVPPVISRCLTHHLQPLLVCYTMLASMYN